MSKKRKKQHFYLCTNMKYNNAQERENAIHNISGHIDCLLDYALEDAQSGYEEGVKNMLFHAEFASQMLRNIYERGHHLNYE
jgi:hypothetical protein